MEHLVEVRLSFAKLPVRRTLIWQLHRPPPFEEHKQADVEVIHEINQVDGWSFSGVSHCCLHLLDSETSLEQALLGAIIP